MHNDEISIQELFQKIKRFCRYLLGKWKIVVIVAIAGGLIGFTYAYLKKPIYTAECTFVLEESGGGNLGQYAGLASMVGIDIGGGVSNGIFQGENIFELYKSRLMIEKTLLSTAAFSGDSVLLIDRYIEINRLKDRWVNKPSLKNLQFDIPKNEYSIAHDSIISVIAEEIRNNQLVVEKPDKKLSIISVVIRSPDQLFAKAFTEKIVENVNKFYIQTKTKKSNENVQILAKQADSVKRVLNQSIGGAASAIDAHPNANPAFQSLRVPSQRRQVDVQASSAIYAEVVKNLEISRISMRKEAPLIQVIDKPVLPLPVNKASKVASSLTGGFLTAVAYILSLIIAKFFKYLARI